MTAQMDELTQERIVYILYIHTMYLINSSEVNGIKIILSNASSDPIYIQIMNQIRQSILSGELRAGDSLPSIRQLAKDLQVSVITTKRAYEELENEKLIDSVVGKGSFVSGANKDFIREQRMKQLEEKMMNIIRESKELNMSQQDVIDHLTLLFEEEQTP
jgi:GntR family transcriptional regulator